MQSAIGTGLLLAEAKVVAAHGQYAATAPGGDSWRSQSLRDQPATGPNGAVAAAETVTVNARMGAEEEAIREVAPGVYLVVS